MKTRFNIAAVIIVLLGMGFYSSLFAQDESNTDANNKPSVHIKVNKQTDKDGNIISYDSVYTYTFNGKDADTAFINNMMRNNMGGASMQFLTHPGSAMPNFMTDPFFQHMDMSTDMDHMQKMMQKEMQQFIQNAGMNNMQDFFQMMQKPVPQPKKCPKQPNCPAKKCPPKNNVNKGDVQI